MLVAFSFFFFFQAEDGIRDLIVTGVQTCALPICGAWVTVYVDDSLVGVFRGTGFCGFYR